MSSLNLNKEAKNSELTIIVEGRVDTSTAPELEASVKESIEGIEKLVFDFKGLEYISSAGLRVLLSTQKIMSKQGEMIIRNVSSEIMEIFDVTGFADILTIE